VIMLSLDPSGCPKIILHFYRYKTTLPWCWERVEVEPMFSFLASRTDQERVGKT